jgi:hypothetical protein
VENKLRSNIENSPERESVSQCYRSDLGHIPVYTDAKISGETRGKQQEEREKSKLGSTRGDLPVKAISGSSAMSLSPRDVLDEVGTGPEVPVQSDHWGESKQGRNRRDVTPDSSG